MDFEICTFCYYIILVQPSHQLNYVPISSQWFFFCGYAIVTQFSPYGNWQRKNPNSIALVLATFGHERCLPLHWRQKDLIISWNKTGKALSSFFFSFCSSGQNAMTMNNATRRDAVAFRWIFLGSFWRFFVRCVSLTFFNLFFICGDNNKKTTTINQLEDKRKLPRVVVKLNANKPSSQYFF